MLLAGALATCVACLGVAPAEAVRIRCVASDPALVPGTVGGAPIASEMVAANGLGSLWKGLPPLLVRQSKFNKQTRKKLESHVSEVYHELPCLRRLLRFRFGQCDGLMRAASSPWHVSTLTALN